MVKFSLATVDDLTLTPSLGAIPCEFPDDVYLTRNCRMIALRDSENRMIVSSFVWTKHRNLTDERTDRIDVAITALALRAMRSRCKKINK